MKKLFQVLIGSMLCCSLLLSGCSSSTSPVGSAQEHYSDEEFMTSLAQGLEARWKVSNNYDKKWEQKNMDVDIGSDEHIQAYTEFVNAELDAVSAYKDARFRDDKLKEKVLVYINSLQEQMDALDYAAVDSEKYSEMWASGYNERCKLLQDFVENYGLTVSEQYQTTLKELLTNSRLVQEEEEANEKLDKLLSEIEFKCVENSYGYRTYQAVIENNIGVNIKTLQLSINLLDADDILVETAYDDVSNLRKGKKAKLEFSTEKEFKSTEVALSYWEKDE